MDPAASENGTLVGIGLDVLPDGVVVVGRDESVELVNPAAERVLGVSAGEVVGQPAAKVLPLQDTKGRDWWQCAKPFTGLRTVTAFPEQRLLVLAGSAPREVLLTGRVVRAADGTVERVVLGVRDTRSRAREEMSRAELVSTVAHELRSPLTSVKGFTATLLARWERFSDEQKRLMLETVHSDADRVTRLISELLDIARIDTGRLEVRAQPVDIPAAVRRHVTAYLANGYDGEHFSVDVADDLPEVWADPDKLDQVLGNLLENAVRHGAGPVTVMVRPARSGEPSVEVTVTDSGEGIPEELIGRVFTKFWRSGRRGGTGLGLYIVRGLVEAHGGGIEVGRAPGGGALFRFRLPAGAPDYVS